MLRFVLLVLFVYGNLVSSRPLRSHRTGGVKQGHHHLKPAHGAVAKVGFFFWDEDWKEVKQGAEPQRHGRYRAIVLEKRRTSTNHTI